MNRWDLPPPFECVICGRKQTNQHWFAAMERRPPVCRWCAIEGGPQVRIAGMTRGDHHQLQRLFALAEGLKWEASYAERRV